MRRLRIGVYVHQTMKKGEILNSTKLIEVRFSALDVKSLFNIVEVKSVPRNREYALPPFGARNSWILIERDVIHPIGKKGSSCLIKD